MGVVGAAGAKQKSGPCRALRVGETPIFCREIVGSGGGEIAEPGWNFLVSANQLGAGK